MAVYKPSNCTPFLEKLDLTEDHDISFVINTNNTAVSGYKIKILDSNNDVLFEGNRFVEINKNVLAYNGDFITLPLIRKINERSEATNTNVIYYLNDKYQYNNDLGELKEITRFGNGFSNQPYKWQIILAQGLLQEHGALTQMPTEDKYYDMTISSGNILGSTPNRIQGELSEEIYKDYFVQLCDQDGKDIAQRVLVSSYDHTYGYIYPQEGEFTQDDINNSKYFKIYKNTNNIKYINTNRIVNYKTGIPMGSVKYSGHTNTVDWGISSDGVYFYQLYADVPRPEGTTGESVQVSVPVASYTNKASAGNLVPSKTTLLVTEETDASEEAGSKLSKYNGVFLFVSGVWKQGPDDVSVGAVTITWMRPAMADTWAEFLGQSFFVEETAENWDSNATSSGVINSTPLMFKEEEAIKIYPNKNNDVDKERGAIYKTNEYVEGSAKRQRVYIRPLVGLSSGMRFTYTNASGTGYINNINIDQEHWCFEYEASDSSTGTLIQFTPDVDTYSIVSFFKTSDENPFYGYSKPNIDITKINGNDFTDEEMIVAARSINVVGEYEQTENKTWKSFQWRLLDYNYNTEQYSETQYGGEISANFVGLEDGHTYEITLIMEDEFGSVTEASKIFQIGNIEFKNPFEDTLQEGLNCELHSVDVSLAGNFGIIVPGIVNEEKVGQYYKTVKIGEGDVSVNGGISESTNGNVTLNFETQITDGNFSGDIIGIEFGTNLTDNAEIDKNSKTKDIISLSLPPLTITKDNGDTIVNDKRYRIQLYRKIKNVVNNRISAGETQDVTLIKNGEETLDWETGRKVCYAYNDTGESKNSECDYINFDVWSTGERNLKFNINKVGYNFKKTLDQWSKTEAPEQTNGEISGVWYDKKTELLTQPDGSQLLVETEEDNLLPTDEEAVWSDYGYQPYVMQKVLDETGRELIKNYAINVNMAYKNYIYQPDASVECYVRCELKNDDSQS